jgi:hypothetical protein
VGDRGRILALAGSLALIALAFLVTRGEAQIPGPLNDLGALGQGEGQTPEMAPKQHNAEPPLTATPRANCGAGARKEPGIQGRVPAGSASKGFICNLTLVSHQGTAGGFRVHRYVDLQGHECAFYDTALLFPLNAFNPAGQSLGVAVVDMSDPAHPKQTDTLTTPPMLSPHESLNLSPARGLLAAVNGNPATYPGLVAIYSVKDDCRHPVLQSMNLLARFGHESGFSQDGRTFYATGTAVQSITAIDVTDPQNPHPIWQGNVISHGMELSNDGNRAYIADVTGGDMAILDTSEIQARKPNPQVREVSRLAWKSASLPQNAIPFTRDGKPYVLEFDEYTASTLNPSGDKDQVGGARIIDISDETKPRVVANLRLQVNQPKDHAEASGDPGANNPAQGYAAHYCNIPTRVDPKVVACSFIASGLRVFDISKITKPKEIGYFVAPPTARVENGGQASNFAMSQPTIVADRREIWFTEGETGLYVLRVAKDVWPAPSEACSARTKKQQVKVRRAVTTRVSVRLAKGGRGVRGKSVRLRGPGFDRRKKTSAGGRVSFKVKPSKSGPAIASTSYCGGKLSVKASRVKTRHRRAAAADPSFTG